MLQIVVVLMVDVFAMHLPQYKLICLLLFNQRIYTCSVTMCSYNNPFLKSEETKKKISNTYSGIHLLNIITHTFHPPHPNSRPTWWPIFLTIFLHTCYNQRYSQCMVANITTNVNVKGPFQYTIQYHISSHGNTLNCTQPRSLHFNFRSYFYHKLLIDDLTAVVDWSTTEMWLLKFDWNLWQPYWLKKQSLQSADNEWHFSAMKTLQKTIPIWAVDDTQFQPFSNCMLHQQRMENEHILQTIW